MGKHLGFILQFFICFIFKSVISTEFIPVFMWETDRPSELIPALHKMSEDAFKDVILESSKTDPLIVVFLEHTLSPEDFSQKNQAGYIAFSNLANLKKTLKVTYRPYVQNPLSAVKQIGKEVTELPISSVFNNLNVPKDNILVVDLNDAKDDELRFNMLQRHDKDVVAAYNKIKEHYGDNILALYTARHTSWVAPDEVLHQGRRLLAEEDKAPEESSKASVYCSSSACIALTDSIYMNMTNSKDDSRINVTQIIFNSTAEGNSTVNISIKDEKNGLEVGFLFKVLNSTGYYKLDDMSLVYKGKNYSVTYPSIVVPTAFSYHCGKALFRFGNKNENNMTIPGYQVFPYIFYPYANSTCREDCNNKTFRFPDAYDCIGFTTVPIWSGIFVTFILLLILTFGLTMMVDIRTMDRFDDPKGKTITINASE